MELYQFRHSAFCEKVRLLLSAKQLSYRVIEVTPGIGQVELFRLSGQRQVPVLKDGADVVADSTTIAQFLEEAYPEPPLIPEQSGARALALLLEDWADTSLATGVRMALLQAASHDPILRKALLPSATPAPLKGLVGAMPADLLGGVGQVFGRGSREQLLASLEHLSQLVREDDHLVDDVLSIADLAVAAQLYHLKFPASAGVELRQRGVPGIVDNPLLEPLFSWRDGIYRKAYRGLQEESGHRPPQSPGQTTAGSARDPGPSAR